MDKKWIVVYKENDKHVAVITSNEYFVNTVREDIIRDGGYIIHNLDEVVNVDEVSEGLYFGR